MLIVQKYGGTSVGSVERIHAVAQRCLATQRQGHDVVVIVSAMAGETNRLLALARAVNDDPSPEAERELDVIAATGEQVSVGLVSLALHKLGGKAQSFLGAQIRILTDSAFTRARIKSIDAARIHEALGQGKIAVVAGFQGIDDDGNITTLGRGGSDTSAVAIAAALGAGACEIYTDVDGVYTTDPNICPNARKIDRISYEEMLELASLGAKVLQIRSVELGMKYGVHIRVLSSFIDASGPKAGDIHSTAGTWVVPEEKQMEHVQVAGVTMDRNEAKVTLIGVPDQPGVVARIFKPLSEANIVVDLILQNISATGRTDVTFTVPRGDLKRAVGLIQQELPELTEGGIRTDDQIAKVSVVGVGMRSHAGVAQRTFELLAKEGINIQAISTSEIKISVVVEAKYAELAVRALHDGFGLGDPAATRS
ncbi:MAG TPA: aspartate kinase [Polyangia bacterium]|jgi:aspartate kinase|nr:aspartate kinase [Polyangia bacterium]